MTNVEQRAGVYAALGEPVRLSILDHLVLGDASPGDLAVLLGLGTNLLAHHLKVLEEAGIIRRVRSEGDRRRAYVQLCLDIPLVRAAAAAGPGQPIANAPIRCVLFVCTANSARSQLAAASWNRISPVPATSAGTHPAARVHPGAIAVGRRNGLHLGRARPHKVDGTATSADLLVAVCDNAHEELDPTTARLHWSIPDPVRVDTDEAFETAYQDITRRVRQLADALTSPNRHQLTSDRKDLP